MQSFGVLRPLKEADAERLLDIADAIIRKLDEIDGEYDLEDDGTGEPDIDRPDEGAIDWAQGWV